MRLTKKPTQCLILRWMLLGGGLLVGGFISSVFGQAPRQRQLRWGSNGNNNNDLKQKFQLAKAKMIQKLEQEYGAERFQQYMMTEYTNTTQRRVTIGRRFFASPSVPQKQMETHENQGPSWQRLVDRMAMKILIGRSSSGDADNFLTPFVWATGGHSSAAAHGNYYNESYTATLERTAKGVFEAVGLDLVGRNYAMGGTSSGKEVASCTKEIFGLDMDVLSWDFGMTDGRGGANMEYYFTRASLSPSRPALYAFQAKYGREDALKRLEDMGLTTLFEFGALYGAMERDGMPKCDEMNSAEVEAMPPMVRECSCTADTGCATAKWTKYGNELCDKRSFQTSWHPGWKWHGLVGNFIALGLMEALEDAVNMIETQGSDPQALLKQLQQQQDADYKLFRESPIPESAKDALKIKNTDPTTYVEPTDIDLETIYKGPNICHTARLPAETRHLGILTESNEKGFYDYYKGITQAMAESSPPEDGIMPLTFHPGDRQQCPYAAQDFKDWFNVQGGQEWSKLVVPNAREAQVYGPQTKNQEPPLKGYIGMCVKSCPWGKCPKSFVTGIEDDQSIITVNGQQVMTLSYFGDCRFLKGKQGHVWPPNANGQWEVSFKVNTPGAYMPVSAIMIW